MAGLLRFTGFLLVLVAVGIGSFLVSRALFLGPEGMEQVVSAGAPTPTPIVKHATVTPRDPSKLFVGSLNGFEFYLPEKFDYPAYSRTWSPKCVTTEKGNNVRYAAEAEWKGSRLDFTVTYSPAGARQTYAGATACEDDIITVQKDFGGPFDLSVFRLSGPPFIETNFRPEQLEATTIGGRPAIIVRPDRPKGRTAIFLRDSISNWTVSGLGLSLEDVIKVAEGVK